MNSEDIVQILHGALCARQTVRKKWILEGKMILVPMVDDHEKMLLEKSACRLPKIIIRQKIEDFWLKL